MQLLKIETIEHGYVNMAHIPKKIIRDNNELKSAMTIHYDARIKTIPNTNIIVHMKPLWPPTLYLTHKKKNNLRNI
jgi:hypothetical protein